MFLRTFEQDISNVRSFPILIPVMIFDHFKRELIEQREEGIKQELLTDYFRVKKHSIIV